MRPRSVRAGSTIGEQRTFRPEPPRTDTTSIPRAAKLTMPALGLARGGMRVIMTGRDHERTETARSLVMLGSDTPFREDLHQLRKHRATQVIAKCVFELMKGSPLREASLNYDIDGEIQDPYNLRCAAQILGPCLSLRDGPCVR